MFAGLLLVACGEAPNEDVTIESKPKEAGIVSPVNHKLDEKKQVRDTLIMDNGIVIKWFQHGTGETLKRGEMVAIDYKVELENGELVDGNRLNGKESIPFMVGFGMQTVGWDLAMKELVVGDFVEIFLPSELARGEKGIPGLIPPNASNTLKMRVVKRMKPTRIVDGNKVWVFEENKKNIEKFDEGKKIEFHCMVSSPSNPLYINTFRDNSPFTLSLMDSGVVPGLKKALINAKKADRMMVLVPSSEAYKSKGYLDLVKPNEDLLYNILVMNVITE